MDNICRIKVIVFDMDGVVIDSNDVIVKYIHGRTTNETIEQLFSTFLPDVKKHIAISAG